MAITECPLARALLFALLSFCLLMGLSMLVAGLIYVIARGVRLRDTETET